VIAVARRTPDAGAPTRRTAELSEGDAVLLTLAPGTLPEAHVGAAVTGSVCCLIPHRLGPINVHVTNLPGPTGQALVTALPDDEWEVDE
jgi:hypothetical protein